jgi:hypothetical protein
MRKLSNRVFLFLVIMILIIVIVFGVNRVLNIKEVKQNGKIVFLFGQLNEQEDYTTLLKETTEFCTEQNQRKNRDFDRESCDVFEVGRFKNDEYIKSLSSIDYLFVYEQKSQFEVQLVNIEGIKKGYLYKKEVDYNPNWINFTEFKTALGE